MRLRASPTPIHPQPPSPRTTSIQLIHQLKQNNGTESDPGSGPERSLLNRRSIDGRGRRAAARRFGAAGAGGSGRLARRLTCRLSGGFSGRFSGRFTCRLSRFLSTALLRGLSRLFSAALLRGFSRLLSAARLGGLFSGFSRLFSAARLGGLLRTSGSDGRLVSAGTGGFAGLGDNVIRRGAPDALAVVLAGEVEGDGGDGLGASAALGDRSEAETFGDRAGGAELARDRHGGAAGLRRRRHRGTGGSLGNAAVIGVVVRVVGGAWQSDSNASAKNTEDSC